MKIILYCQYTWGIGHLFRSLEICRSLSAHEVILVSGGLPVDTPLPGHVREIRLPGLIFDDDYKTLISTVDGMSVDGVKKERQNRLSAFFKEEAPELFIVELYPFGRRAFRYELDPVLKAIRNGTLPSSLVVCSIRDVLVEKKDPGSYEKRVIDTLNRYFDALLIHSDPCLQKLDETFSRIDDIDIPVFYTGFVTPKPASGEGVKFREKLGIKAHERLVVASAGGGRSGAPLLEALTAALPLTKFDSVIHLHVFTGPFVSDEVFGRLKAHPGKTVRVSHFTPDFLPYLAAADLSVSMAGYNTSMNILASGVPSLVWPFADDREQGVRAEKMARIGATEVLGKKDLDPPRLAAILDSALSRGRRSRPRIDLDGAKNTADWIASFLNGRRFKK